jgi:hypothetical protein
LLKVGKGNRSSIGATNEIKKAVVTALALKRCC